MNGSSKGASKRVSACFLVGASFAFVGAATPTAAAASDLPRFEIRVGATFFDADASFETTRTSEPALAFSVDDLGIDDGGARLFASGVWRITDRWLVQVDTFGFDGRGSRAGTVEAAIGNQIVEAEVVLDGQLDLDLYVLNVGYRLIARNGIEAGVGAGVHYVKLDYGLTAATLPEHGGVEFASFRSSDEFPAPNIYAWASWRFDGSFRGDLKAGWLAVESGNFDGRIYFARASLQYGFTDYFGIGVGYWLTDFDVDRESSNRLDNYNVRLRGPQLYLNFAF
jgi:hypothetical protein